jgi:hypothetical protein
MPDSPEPYDAGQFDPPAPVARVILRSPDGAATVADVLLLLDTGADITLLPRRAVERLGVQVQVDASYELMGFDGARSAAPAADLDMLFLRRAFRGRYALIDAERGVLGRDVLNHLTLLLDGPRQQWSPHPP